MKRILLSFVLTFGFFSLATAQVEAYIEGGSTNYINSVYNVSPTSGVVAPLIQFKNVSGISGNWTVTRERINEISAWHDYLCWGHETDIFGGTCYTASNMGTNPWTTPAGFNVNNGEKGNLVIDVAPDYDFPGTVTYRYSVHSNGGPSMGYVDVVVYVASSGIEENEKFEVSIAPNPANDFINIKTNGTNNQTYTIVDVLGNIIKKESITNSTKSIDVRKFKNGIYFITIETEGEKAITRKVIVRH